MDAKYLPGGLNTRGVPSNVPAKRLETASVPSMVASLAKDWGYRGPPPKSKQARFDPVPATRAPRYPGPTPKGLAPSPSAPKRWGKSGCVCDGCGPRPKPGDVLHTKDGPECGGPCHHFVDMPEPLPGNPRTYRRMRLAFTPSEYAALTAAWTDYERAHPRPGIGMTR